MDYNAINSSINKSSQSTYAAKLNEVISGASIKNVSYSNTSNGGIYSVSAGFSQHTLQIINNHRETPTLNTLCSKWIHATDANNFYEPNNSLCDVEQLII